MPGDYMRFHAIFSPFWGDAYISHRSEIRYGSAPNTRIRQSTIRRNKLCIRSQCDKNNKRGMT